MKTLFVAIVSTMSVMSAVAATNAVARPLRNQSGGMLTVPRKASSKQIFFINAQSRVNGSVIDESRRRLSDGIRTPIDMASGHFDFPNPKVEGELSLYLIDDEAMPASLIAPEGRWAFVNVAPLAKGRGEKSAYLEARTRKQIARVGSMLFGGIGSSYKGNLLSPINRMEKLDEYAADTLPFDALVRCTVFLSQLGVEPYPKVPYRAAVVAGWAPAPTNDVQKAIWDKVHALPTEPIKIKPETKKVTE